MKCTDCKHWGAGVFIGDRGEIYGYDYEDEPDTRTPHRVCNRVVHAFVRARNDGRIEPAASDAVYLMDASGYSASLWCSAEFGCELGEPK